MGLKGVIMRIPHEFMIGELKSDQSAIREDNSFLSQEDFLKILAAEISNPSFDMGEGGGGGGKTDYMGQLIQMNMLDQMSELTTSIQSTMLMTQQQQALSLVGQTVKVLGEDDFVIGVVDKVSFKNGFATIQINGKEYSLNDVIEVGEVDDAE